MPWACRLGRGVLPAEPAMISSSSIVHPHRPAWDNAVGGKAQGAWRKMAGSAAACIAMLAANVAYADTVWISSGGGNPVPYSGVRVLRVEQDTLFFRTSGGLETSRPVNAVTRIQLDDDPTFSSAEAAHVGGDFARATEGYLRTLRSTPRGWLRDWVTLRLVDSAAKAGRVDAAVTAYLQLLSANPAAAPQAKPRIPEGPSALLDAAAVEIERSMASVSLDDPARRSAMNLLIEVHRARGDNASAARATERLLEREAARPEGGASQVALADVRLNAARLALDQGDFAGALSLIDENQALFTQPGQQAAALLTRARARHGQGAKRPGRAGRRRPRLHACRCPLQGTAVGLFSRERCAVRGERGADHTG